MFSPDQLRVLHEKHEEYASPEEAAEALGVHRTTLERRLLKEHHLVLEVVRTFRLVPLIPAADADLDTTPKIDHDREPVAA